MNVISVSGPVSTKGKHYPFGATINYTGDLILDGVHIDIDGDVNCTKIETTHLEVKGNLTCDEVNSTNTHIYGTKKIWKNWFNIMFKMYYEHKSGKFHVGWFWTIMCIIKILTTIIR